MGRKMIYAEVTVGDDLVPDIVTPDVEDCTCGSCSGLAEEKKPRRVTLVVNTCRTVIRVQELVGRDNRLTPAVKWRLVQENFPLGPLMNEDTHIFDGSVFENSAGGRYFMMAALPKAIAEPIGEMGVEKWGSPHRLARLDTIEHVLFRHYAGKAPGLGEGRDIPGEINEKTHALWVVFPQSDGFRVLHMSDGVPQGGYSISNHPELREAELSRVLGAATPEQVVLLTREKEKSAVPPEDSGTTTEGMFASLQGLESRWLPAYFQDRGVDVQREVLHCVGCMIGG